MQRPVECGNREGIFDVRPVDGYGVHITQGDHVGKSVIVSWVTPVKPGSTLVRYGKVGDNLQSETRAMVTTYKFGNYASGYIHHRTLDDLEYNTVGTGNSSRQFSFTTPPEAGPDVPHTFGIIDVRFKSNPNARVLLFVGDPSYADHYPLHDNRSEAYQIYETVYHDMIYLERISNIAYNKTSKDRTPTLDSSAPVYITVADGGNIEGLANNCTQPQPNCSAYREASFGHAILEIKNRTHGYHTWHRNDDGDKAIGDSVRFYNRYWQILQYHLFQG
ncbi:Purple acid phosphatase [Cocos nucifera]|uniref:Purple acid phosphatase n=1 Tax=Cocos nucifera TaxID=13894 RepID=A0A8K0I4N0_COCNU|nr:Purple acid phosphatase [Cocos nucifera]